MTDTDFVRAILADPADDAIRLVFADFLEENGDAERAEFVRVQLRLASEYQGWSGEPTADSLLDGGPYAILRRREQELLAAHWRAWSFPAATDCLNSGYLQKGAVGVEFRRGFVTEVRCRLSDWVGGVCGRCKGTREITVGHNIRGAIKWQCRDCHGTGRTIGHGPTAAACQPVRRLVLSGWAIAEGSGNPIRLRAARHGEYNGEPWPLEVHKGEYFSVDEHGEVEVVLVP